MRSRWPSAVRLTAPLLATVLICGLAREARATTKFSPYATVTVEHNSNVFMRPSSAPPFAVLGNSALADTIQKYEGGVDGQIDWSAERLKFSGHATRESFNRFSFLDHEEYQFDGDLSWRLGKVLDGALSYKQTRFMAPFADTLSTQLLLDTERTAKAVVRVEVSPKWRIDLTPTYHELDTPLPAFPDFRLQEKGAAAVLQYLGFGRLEAGLRFAYTKGRYADIAGATRYWQRSAGLTATYQVAGFSSLEARIGYTQRNTEPNLADTITNPGGVPVGIVGYVSTLGRTSRITGKLNYSRQLTGKTSVHLSAYRRVDSYTAGANPMIGTGGAIGFAWRADAKMTVFLDYSQTREQIQGALIVADVVNRSDRVQWGRIYVRYRALSWLSVRPFVIWERQVSSYALGNFRSTTVGIDITGRLDL